MKRIISTVEELEALPHGTLFFDPTGMLWARDEDDERFSAEFVLSKGPVTVIWRPDTDMIADAWDEGSQFDPDPASRTNPYREEGQP